MDNGSRILSDLERLCPVCQMVIAHTSKSNCTKHKHKNSPCRSCSNSIQKGGVGQVHSMSGEKKCARCKRYKPLDDYTWVNAKRGYHGYCNECRKAHLRQYSETVGRFKKVGVSKALYDRLMIEQNGVCRICAQPMTEPCVDHCHSTGRVRGLLCRKCNAALGLFGDDTARLERAIAYLMETQQSNG